MILELKHLRTLTELHETGSLAAAAERLHLTQSALSHQLKGLEQRIGQPLFERKRRPLRLSPAGLRLLELAQRVLPEVRRAEADIALLGEGMSGRLHLVVECHSCYDWLLPAMDVYRRDWPEVELDLINSESFAALPALAEGKVDLVVTSDPIDDPELRFDALFGFEILLAMARGHRLAERPWLCPQDLRAETLITYPVERARLDVFRRFLEPAGVEPAGVRTSELSVMLLQLVKSGRGVSALPNWVLASALDAREIAAARLGPEGLWSTLYAATRARDHDRAYLAAFIGEARASAQRVLEGVVPARGGVVPPLGRLSS
ncbi:LysR family transcriptional regulator [Marichromatium bheemlicum]|uniref:HTH-type transcriptional regulator MetR n=1 Tax=Marichromatium bheemlicum TaxID=365339 RepID=A0ABX1IAK3_9GAMM|nr:LysR family transcriptional regulator [Marichromatium bheemlicum]NKN34283.1 LysR family transcriptional regulator [Marichromatium bheemlicum]